jgi:hypothetical protein
MAKLISFRNDVFSFEQINEKYNVDLSKDYIIVVDEKITNAIPIKTFLRYKSEYDNFYLLSDRIRFSVFNENTPYNNIRDFSNILKAICLNTLKQFSGNVLNENSFRIMVKGITEQPLYLSEALHKYPDELPENDRYYFRHEYIFDKIRFIKDKFKGYKPKLEKEIRLLSATDSDKLKMIYKRLFNFIEQFISDLEKHQHEFRFLDSPLFKIFFEEIIYFKSYYQSEFGEFHYPEINKIEKALSIDNTSLPKKQKDEEMESIQLSKIFIHVSKYNKVMEILVKNGYCQPNTYIWIDSQKSNKATIVFLLRDHLHAQRYYKGNKKPTAKQVKVIAKNTFGCDISESHIKQSKIEDITIQKIIPPASSL